MIFLNFIFDKGDQRMSALNFTKNVCAYNEWDITSCMIEPSYKLNIRPHFAVDSNNLGIQCEDL